MSETNKVKVLNERSSAEHLREEINILIILGKQIHSYRITKFYNKFTQIFLFEGYCRLLQYVTLQTMPAVPCGHGKPGRNTSQHWTKEPAKGSSLSTAHRKEENPKREETSVFKPVITEAHKCLLVEGELNELLQHIVSRVESIDHWKQNPAAPIKHKLVSLYYLYTDLIHYFNSYTNSILLHRIFNFSLVMLKISEKLVPLQ